MSQPELICQWIEDPKIGWWHLPGCWGAVNAGPDGCYCEPEKNSVLGRLASLEATVAGLKPASAFSESTEDKTTNGPTP